MTVASNITNGSVSLGIEFGSTRIKAVLIDSNNRPLASGSFGWENQQENGIWTYSKEIIWDGLQTCYKDLKQNVLDQYGVSINTLQGIGISGMMHGYVALDQDNQLLVPFRTWRNTITEEATKILSPKLDFHVPQRWTVAHLYQAILNNEEHLSKVEYITTLPGYVHYLLTGNKVVGICEGSGIFPIDSDTLDYDQKRVELFDELIKDSLSKSLRDLFPSVLNAGQQAGTLTEAGALLLDPSGDLQPGVPFAPPEGDAGTGMVATNSIKMRTGNVSAGTSVFAMIVLDNALSKPHDAIDIITTPHGKQVALVHANNCSSDINAWVGLFGSVLEAFGTEVDTNTLYTTLFQQALRSDSEFGGILNYNYFSGEHITGMEHGRPLMVRKSNSPFTVQNVMKTQLFSALATLRIGMDVLLHEEQIEIDSLTGHGGLFLTPKVGQKILASALNAPVTVMETAGEGGPYGMAVLVNYMVHGQEEELPSYLENNVFRTSKKLLEHPDPELIKEFNQYMESYIKGLPIEQAAIKYY